MTAQDRTRFPAILVGAGAATAVAAVGGTLTDLGPWYQSLVKPDWQPPGPAFGIVWTLIFAMATASGLTAWRRARRQATREWIIGLFALNGFLNVTWSLLFFRLRRPDWAMLEIAPFWLSILVLMVFLWRLSRRSSLLLGPYIAWVSIAGALNLAIIRLNPAFG